jgi:hypothetical protein
MGASSAHHDEQRVSKWLDQGYDHAKQQEEIFTSINDRSGASGLIAQSQVLTSEGQSAKMARQLGSASSYITLPYLTKTSQMLRPRFIQTK